MENEAAPKKCPVCEACSRGGTLLLRQINATEAIYVCDNSKVGVAVTVLSVPFQTLGTRPDWGQGTYM